eukprot:332071-Chlamydomonas_euryale.AAC.1
MTAASCRACSGSEVWTACCSMRRAGMAHTCPVPMHPLVCAYDTHKRAQSMTFEIALERQGTAACVEARLRKQGQKGEVGERESGQGERRGMMPYRSRESQLQRVDPSRPCICPPVRWTDPVARTPAQKPHASIHAQRMQIHASTHVVTRASASPADPAARAMARVSIQPLGPWLVCPSSC